MSQLLKKVIGKNGEIELYEDRVIINREKSTHYGDPLHLFQGLKGKASLSMNEIASVRFKEAGFIGNGYIRIDIKGRLLHKR